MRKKRCRISQRPRSLDGETREPWSVGEAPNERRLHVDAENVSRNVTVKGTGKRSALIKSGVTTTSPGLSPIMDYRVSYEHGPSYALSSHRMSCRADVGLLPALTRVPIGWFVVRSSRCTLTLSRIANRRCSSNGAVADCVPLGCSGRLRAHRRDIGIRHPGQCR